MSHGSRSTGRAPRAVLVPAVDRVIRDPAFDRELRSRIQRWAHRARFRRYLSDNAGKIAKKLRQARSLEDQRDVGVELFAARMFLDAGCSVTPEPRRAGPDLLVVVGGESFYCEVARIREARLQDEWDSLISQLKERAEPLEQNVCVQLELVRLGEEDLILRLVEERFEELVGSIRDAGSLSSNAETIIDLEFVPRGTLQLRVTPLPRGSRGYFECPVDPVFFTQLEYRKLSDILCAKLRQLQPDAPNVLYVRSNSSTHAQSDLAEAIEQLGGRAARGDDAFFERRRLGSAQAFQAIASRLAAVVFDDLWTPVDDDRPSARVWYHEPPASVLSPRVREKLEAACWVRW